MDRRRRKHDQDSNGGAQIYTSRNFNAKTKAAVSHILEICDLGGNFDDADNDNYWLDPEEPVSELLKTLKESGQIEAIDFDLDLEWFSKYLATDAKKTLPMDHKTPFDKKVPSGSTKRAFCIDLCNVMSQNGIKFKQINKIFEVFQRHQTSLNLPIKARNPLLKTKPGLGVSNNIQAYTGKDDGSLVIDICKNDCIAFHGVQWIKGKLIDCAKEIVCPVCCANRFSHCRFCPDLDYGQCNPFVLCGEVNTKSGMGHQGRLPEKTLFYRPITTKLLNLYKLSLMEGNEALLSYFQDKYRVTRLGWFHSVQLCFCLSDIFFPRRSCH
jgi:hypothetical protein